MCQQAARSKLHLVLTEVLVVDKLIKHDDCARDDLVAEEG